MRHLIPCSLQPVVIALSSVQDLMASCQSLRACKHTPTPFGHGSMSLGTQMDAKLKLQHYQHCWKAQKCAVAALQWIVSHVLTCLWCSKLATPVSSKAAAESADYLVLGQYLRAVTFAREDMSWEALDVQACQGMPHHVT